jgi:hypothetical protein
MADGSNHPDIYSIDQWIDIMVDSEQSRGGRSGISVKLESWCLNTVQSLQKLSKQIVDSSEGQMYFHRNLCKA